MSPYGYRRFIKWEEGGRRPIGPMGDGRPCLRADLPDSNWVFEEINSTLGYRLRHIDRDFEVIYDRCTARDGMAPGHHLYRVVKRGGTPGDDLLLLEFSLQQDLSEVWPLGKPLAPGDWLIRKVQELHKSKMSGNETQIEAELDRRRTAEADAIHDANEKEKREAIQHFENETDPYVNRGRTLPTVHIPKAKKQGKKAKAGA